MQRCLAPEECPESCPAPGRKARVPPSTANNASTLVWCFCWPPNVSSPCRRKARCGSRSLSFLESANRPARALPLPKQLVPARCYLSGFLHREMSGQQIASAFGACRGSSTVSPSGVLAPSRARHQPFPSLLLTPPRLPGPAEPNAADHRPARGVPRRDGTSERPQRFADNLTNFL